MPLSIKVAHGDEIRRLRVDGDSAAEVLALVRETFELREAHMFWQDDEGDAISVKTDGDLAEALVSIPGAVPKFIVLEAEIPPATAAPPLTNPVLAREPGASVDAGEAPASATAAGIAVTAVASSPSTPDAFNIVVDVNDEGGLPLPVVRHPGITCDVSGQLPIEGTRYHLMGYDYDVCEAIFVQLPEADKLRYEVITEPGARAVPYLTYRGAAALPPTETGGAVHLHVTCDVTGQSPLTGVRHHLIGENYDVCQSVFDSLPEADKRNYEAIAAPGDRPVPYHRATAAVHHATRAAGGGGGGDGHRDFMESVLPGFNPEMFGAAFEQVSDRVRQHFRGSAGSEHRDGRCPAFGGRGRACGRRGASGSSSGYVAVGAGNLPVTPIAPGSHGPGVAQLQIALIKVGVMDERAVRMRQGVYGRHTAAAVDALRQESRLKGEPGIFCDAVAAVVTAKLDGTYVAPEPEPEPEPEPPVAAPQNPRWEAELDQLAQMGFTDSAVAIPLLEKHQGSIIFAMTELLGR